MEQKLDRILEKLEDIDRRLSRLEESKGSFGKSFSASLLADLTALGLQESSRTKI